MQQVSDYSRKWEILLEDTWEVYSSKKMFAVTMSCLRVGI